jgi:hypothetical protein
MCHCFFCPFFVRKKVLQLLLTLHKAVNKVRFHWVLFDKLRSMCVAVKLLRGNRSCMHHQTAGLSLRRRTDCCSCFCSVCLGLGWRTGRRGSRSGRPEQSTLTSEPVQEEKVARRSNYSLTRVSPRLPWARSIGFLFMLRSLPVGASLQVRDGLSGRL